MFSTSCEIALVEHPSVQAMVSPLTYFPIPAFTDNYIWAVSNEKYAVIVDPGVHEPVISYLAERGLKLAAVVLTHHHPDHVAGVKPLLAAWAEGREVPVYGPGASGIASVTEPVGRGDRVKISELDFVFSVLEVPGHTLDHVAFFLPGKTGSAGTVPHLFCGDALFASGCGRLFEGTPTQMVASLDTFAALPDSTQVHCAHEYTLVNINFALSVEPDNNKLRTWHKTAADMRRRGVPTLPTTIGLEKDVNPFLRIDDPGLRARVGAAWGVDATDRIATFAALRNSRNSFTMC